MFSNQFYQPVYTQLPLTPNNRILDRGHWSQVIDWQSSLRQSTNSHKVIFPLHTSGLSWHNNDRSSTKSIKTKAASNVDRENLHTRSSMLFHSLLTVKHRGETRDIGLTLSLQRAELIQRYDIKDREWVQWRLVAWIIQQLTGYHQSPLYPGAGTFAPNNAQCVDLTTEVLMVHLMTFVSGVPGCWHIKPSTQ
jgi:hypothetical protein